MSNHYRLERTSDIPLEFDGELLADVSSQYHTGGNYTPAMRWTEHRIYRTVTGYYVVETVGVSLMPGEVNRRSACAVDDAKQISDALKAPRTYLTYLGRYALEQAHMRDNSIPLTEAI